MISSSSFTYIRNFCCAKILYFPKQMITFVRTPMKWYTLACSYKYTAPHLFQFQTRRGRPEQRWKQTKIIHKNIWTNSGTVFPISGEGNAVWNVHNLTCQDIFEPLRQIWEYLYNFTAMLPLLCEFLLVTWRLSLKSAEYYSSILLYVLSSPLISAVANFVGNSKFLPGNNLYNILFFIRQRAKAHQICTIST